MKHLIAAVALSTLTACASGVNHVRDYTPLVDMKYADAEVYASDLAECREYGVQVLKAANKEMLLNTLAGAATGAAIGAAFDAPGYGAGAGALAGAYSDATPLKKAQHVVNRCMTSRGYSVLY